MPYKDRDAHRKAQREWVSLRRDLFFSDKACEWCASRVGLQLHHRDPAKKTAHRIWSWSAERRDAEIAKCIVLCGECHRRAHAEVRRVEAELRNPCGTQAAYKRGCKCDGCRAANSEANKTLKERRAA